MLNTAAWNIYNSFIIICTYFHILGSNVNFSCLGVIILLICRVSCLIVIHYINNYIFIMYILATPFSRGPSIDTTVATKLSHVSIDDAQTQPRNCVKKETSMVSSVILMKRRIKLKYRTYTVSTIHLWMYKTVVFTCCLV
jgi:hypothetical protein